MCIYIHVYFPVYPPLGLKVPSTISTIVALLTNSWHHSQKFFRIEVLSIPLNQYLFIYLILWQSDSKQNDMIRSSKHQTTKKYLFIINNASSMLYLSNDRSYTRTEQTRPLCTSTRTCFEQLRSRQRIGRWILRLSVAPMKYDIHSYVGNSNF